MPQKLSEKKVKTDYPYIHPRGTIFYVPQSNEYMSTAKKLAQKFKSNLALPGAAVIVKDGKVIGTGSIGDNPAHIKGCVRVKLNLPTGEGYELCKGCQPQNHSEPRAIRDALSKGFDPVEAELYLWGHWWACKDCWQAMVNAGITNLYLLENSQVLFNKLAPKNIVGKQFA